MNDFFSRRTIIVILTAVLVSLLIMILSAVSSGNISPISAVANVITEPIRGAVSSVSDYFGDWKDKFTRYDEVLAENEELKRKLAISEDKVRKNEAAALENRTLKTALGMKEKNASYDFESCEVVAKNSDNWSSSFTINKGSASGIKVDNCVITAEGMVGFVSEVGPTWATVTSVTDTTMEASAIASRTRDVASAEGDFELMTEGFLRLSYLPRDTKVLKGDVIETSGVGGLFPKGIVIGTVEEVKTETHAISKYAVIKPAVDFDRVNHVIVIKSFTNAE